MGIPLSFVAGSYARPQPIGNSSWIASPGLPASRPGIINNNYGAPGLSKATSGLFHGSSMDNGLAPLLSGLNSVNGLIKSGLNSTGSMIPSWSPFKIQTNATPYNQDLRQRFFAGVTEKPSRGVWIPNDMYGSRASFQEAINNGENMLARQRMMAQQMQANMPPTIVYRRTGAEKANSLGSFGAGNNAWRTQNITGQSPKKGYQSGMRNFVINSSSNAGLNSMR
jgi:hypothetical protein